MRRRVFRRRISAGGLDLVSLPVAGWSRVARRACHFEVAPVWGAEADEGARSRWQTWRSVGMSFAVKSDVHFNADWGEATWVLRAGTFTGLDTADRQVLSDWLDDASGIDTVMDLAARSWNIAGASAILGVFEPDRDQASWLIVRHGSGWTVARQADGFVSDVLDSLQEILGLLDELRRDAADPRATI
jgi:hypothetical protein